MGRWHLLCFCHSFEACFEQLQCGRLIRQVTVSETLT